MRKLILASASPRRREILSSAGFVFDVIPNRKEEEKRGNTPEEIVMHLAEDKAMDVAQQTEKNALVLGADTIVVCEGEIMGKPKDPADAARMLLKLQGRAHQVYTGVAMAERRFGEISISSFCQKTSVFVYPMSEEEIREYIAAGEPMDKAGAYGIQGAFSMYIEKIEGDYLNVVGLPLSRLCRELKTLGVIPGRPCRAVIFDLDGTLADTLVSIAHSTNRSLARLGYPALPVEDYRYYAGDGAKELLKRALRASGDEACENLKRIEPIYAEIFETDCMYQVHPFEGIVETLKELKARGIRLAVLSNKPDARTRDVIASLFGEGLFDYVQGQTDEIRRKPSPDGALKIAEIFGVRPEECMYCGDTNTDMKTGTAAGMYTVGVLWGFRDREELVENGAMELAERPQQLLELL